MSCCGGNCGCGSGCKCGSGCGGLVRWSQVHGTVMCISKPSDRASDGSALHHPQLCKMYPDMSFEGSSTTETLIVGVAPQKTYFEGSEMGAAAENGCKCGSNCQCDPCTCK